jgi:hypothetical protein
MAKRLSAGIVHKAVADVVHDHDDRIEELERIVTTLTGAILDGQKEEAPAKATAKKAAPAKAAAKTPPAE